MWWVKKTTAIYIVCFLLGPSGILRLHLSRKNIACWAPSQMQYLLWGPRVLPELSYSTGTSATFRNLDFSRPGPPIPPIPPGLQMLYFFWTKGPPRDHRKTPRGTKEDPRGHKEAPRSARQHSGGPKKNTRGTGHILEGVQYALFFLDKRIPKRLFWTFTIAWTLFFVISKSHEKLFQGVECDFGISKSHDKLFSRCRCNFGIPKSYEKICFKVSSAILEFQNRMNMCLGISKSNETLCWTFEIAWKKCSRCRMRFWNFKIAWIYFVACRLNPSSWCRVRQADRQIDRQADGLSEKNYKSNICIY